MGTLRLPTDTAPISNREFGINAVIGSGASFPFSFSGSAGTSSVNVTKGLAKINQSIHAILSTRKGERVMRPTFGSRVHAIVFEPNDISTWNRLKFEVADALAAWEKRIRIKLISAINLPDPNAVGIEIQYIVLRVNQPGSYVYPFSLTGEPLSSNLDLRFNG